MQEMGWDRAKEGKLVSKGVISRYRPLWFILPDKKYFSMAQSTNHTLKKPQSQYMQCVMLYTCVMSDDIQKPTRRALEKWKLIY